jgi:hypothetical protein
LALAVLVYALGISAQEEDDQVDVSLLSPSEFQSLLEEDSESEDGDDLMVKDNPAPCCLPKVWQGKVHSLFGVADDRGRKAESQEVDENGRPKIVGSLIMIYVDENNKQVAGKAFCPKTGNVTYQFIMTFGKGVNASGATLYIFSNSAKKCQVKKIPKAQFKPQCIPADAKLEGTFPLGLLSGGVTVQSWGFLVKTRGAFVGENILVTPNNCIPILVREFGVIKPRPRTEEDKPKPKPRPSGKAFAGSVYYSEISLTISDPSVFTPPSFCKATDDKALRFQPEDRDLNSILKRFVR